MSLDSVYEKYRDRARFFVVYIREAHPTDGRPAPRDENRGIDVQTPRSFEERENVAKTCAAKLEFAMPVLVDGMDDGVGEAYAAWPDRLFIVDASGRIAYRGGKGPRGFDVSEMETRLRSILGVDQAERDGGGHDRGPARPRDD